MEAGQAVNLASTDQLSSILSITICVGAGMVTAAVATRLDVGSSPTLRFGGRTVQWSAACLENRWHPEGCGGRVLLSPWKHARNGNAAPC